MRTSEGAEADVQHDPVIRALAEEVQRYRGSEESQISHLRGTGSVAAFERRLEVHYGVRHALCVSNGTCGLFAVGLALGLHDLEFVAPPLTYGGSLAPFLLLNNKPVFTDVDPALLTLDPARIGESVTGRTRAILGVDFLGVPADDRGLREVADEYGLWYIHDAAQSFGATREGRPTGTMADASILSFGPGKGLSTGEGGAILTNDDDLYDRLISVGQHPYRQRIETGLGSGKELSMNFRIHPLAAVWALAEFDEALRSVRERQECAGSVIRVACSSGLVEDPCYDQLQLCPSHYRISMAWKQENRGGDLLNRLALLSNECRISGLDYELLYRLPALSNYAARASKRCLAAEDQILRRFTIQESDSQ